MLKYGLSAALLVAAVPAFAQPASPPHQAPPAVQQASQAFGQCVGMGLQGLAATVTPEAGAASVLGGCATQRQQLEQAAEAYIATMPAAQQAGAREHLRTELGGVEGELVAVIRQHRSRPAPAPAQ